MFAKSVPDIRIRSLNERQPNPSGDYVLYWMTMNRRAQYNFSLQRAVEWCEKLNRPLLILEALRCGYRWSNDRIHRFALQGMADNRAAFAAARATHYAYVEPSSADEAGFLDALAAKACVIITDDFPCFFIPKMLRLVAPSLPVPLEAIDSNGLLPMRAATDVFPTAYAFRRFLQKNLVPHLSQLPCENPLKRKKLPMLAKLPGGLLRRWPQATDKTLTATPETLASLPIDHQVKAAMVDGGAREAERILSRFLDQRLEHYGELRNEPEQEGASGLSPYLHFGHISVHEVFHRLVERESWQVETVLGNKAAGRREGWWGMSAAAESFLDELVTWRELGFNMCWQRTDYDRYESLPEWALKTLAKHEQDPRPVLYSPDELERGVTHDRLWNAAQNQLVREGRMHNYLRMLWGKKILEWSPRPRDALSTMIHLNNKYAVDGRNPNSYSGIFWCLGRYDRAWGPERAIFGTVRYMSSDNTARKFQVKNYIRRYASAEA